MKIQFKEIQIKYYKSIVNASLVYTSGVWLIKGTNNDAFGSNGAGKSTMLEALQQCLYNRTQNGNTLDTTINRKTGKAYDLTVKLSTSEGDYYEINNNRSAMKISIKKLVNNELIDVGTRSTVAALSYIQNLIGLDFNAFVALTHITHSTVVNMIDNFTGSNLLKVLLDFGLIQKLEKGIKDELSQSKKVLDNYLLRETEINKSLNLINSFKPLDISPMYKQYGDILNNFEVLTSEFNTKMIDVQKREHSLNDKLRDTNKNILSIHNTLDTKICSTCGTDLTEAKGISEESLLEELEGLKELQKLLFSSLECIYIEKQEILDTLGTSLEDMKQQKETLSTKIEIQEYNTEMFNKSSSSIKELQNELYKIEKEKPNLYTEHDILASALSVIKQGKLHEGMLSEFCRLNNVYLKELMPYVSIDYLSISTKHNKNSFIFQLEDLRFNTSIDFTELSGGELTRVRLVVLLAMLKTVQVMTNTSVNILVFDEALDTLDSSASDDLANLFRYLSNTENKFISLVSHGQQLSSIDFTGTINVIKTDGSTKIIQDTIDA